VVHSCRGKATVTPITGLTALQILALPPEEAFRVPCSLLLQRSTSLTELSIIHTNPHKNLLNYWFETAQYWTAPLKKLSIVGPVTYNAFSYIASLRTLESLGMERTRLTEENISKILGELTSLRHLSISDRFIPTSDFLRNCSSLLSFHFETSNTLTSNPYFLNNLTCLTSLELNMRMNCLNFNPMPSLTELTLTDVFLIDYSALQELTPNLRSFTLLTSPRFDTIILPRLEYLETFSSTDIAILDLKDYFPNLIESKIILRMNRQLTPEIMEDEDFDEDYSDSGWEMV